MSADLKTTEATTIVQNNRLIENWLEVDGVVDIDCPKSGLMRRLEAPSPRLKRPVRERPTRTSQ